MSEKNARGLVKTFWPEWVENRTDTDLIDRWYRGRLKESDMPSLPTHASRELRDLRDRSVGRWMHLVVSSVAQMLYVEGYRPSEGDDVSSTWDVWQANRWDDHQAKTYRGALAHGLSYVTVLPGVRNGVPMPVFRGKSARRMVGFYDDLAYDEYPMYALEATPVKGKDSLWRVNLYDDTDIWTYDCTEAGDLTFLTVESHGVGVCPVVRYSSEMDLDGRADGEVEPLIPLASRIDQTVYDRLVVQRFSAWVVRWIAGMERPTPLEGETQAQADERLARRLQMSDFLVLGDSDAKAGSFNPTPLEGYIKSAEADIRHFAAVSQTPPHSLLGDMVNLSAEALAAAESGHSRKVAERKHSFGESNEQLFRTSALILGDTVAAADDAAQVQWADLESRSLSQLVDALGKLHQMLGIPAEGLWEKVPGVTKADVEHWRTLVERDNPFAALFTEGLNAVPGAG